MEEIISWTLSKGERQRKKIECDDITEHILKLGVKALATLMKERLQKKAVPGLQEALTRLYEETGL